MEKFSFSNKPYLNILSDDDVLTIHEQALTVLEDVGVRFQSETALSELENKGCLVDYASQTVRFPRSLVKQAILDAPGSFDMYNVKGERTLQLGKGHTYFAPGPGAAAISSPTGVVRRGNILDLQTEMRIVKSSKYLDIVVGNSVPDEVPSEVNDLYILCKAIIESDKTILGEAWNPDAIEGILTVLEAVRSSNEACQEKPFIMLAACPSPPLKWDPHVIANTLASIKYGIPLFVCSSPVLGISAPVTTAGAVLTHTVENLSYIAFIQLMRPGTPVFYGGICSVMDMRTMYSANSSAEACLCTTGYASMARYYGIPSLAFEAQTDAKEINYQAGFETAMCALTSALSGIDVIFGAGTLESYLSFSNEKLAIDSQLFEYIKKISEGIVVDDEQLDLADIQAMGRGETESLMTSDHTLDWYAEAECMTGPIIDRDTHAEWEKKGKTIVERAQEVVKLAEGDESDADAELKEKVRQAFDAVAAQKNIDFRVRF
jgi:trimethylamine--corrinoid protein Co-methyltransferase